MRGRNYGLLLWGQVGTGKSYLAGCVANALMEREIPVCVTGTRIGNTVLVVSVFFKLDSTDTAADKMMKMLEAEAAAGYLPPFSA